jgi:hypothetical protein
MTKTDNSKARRSREEVLRASVNYVAPEGGEVDLDLARMALARKLASLADLPLQCREPRCRRTRRCVGPTMRCARDIPRPPHTAEDDEMLAKFRKDLAARMRARGMR